MYTALYIYICMIRLGQILEQVKKRIGGLSDKERNEYNFMFGDITLDDIYNIGNDIVRSTGEDYFTNLSNEVNIKFGNNTKFIIDNSKINKSLQLLRNLKMRHISYEYESSYGVIGGESTPWHVDAYIFGSNKYYFILTKEYVKGAVKGQEVIYSMLVIQPKDNKSLTEQTIKKIKPKSDIEDINLYNLLGKEINADKYINKMYQHKAPTLQEYIAKFHIPKEFVEVFDKNNTGRVLTTDVVSGKILEQLLQPYKQNKSGAEKTKTFAAEWERYITENFIVIWIRMSKPIIIAEKRIFWIIKPKN